MTSEQEKIIQLVSQIQKGDQAAFSVLYDEFAQQIYAFIRIKITGNTEQAEDILQDVFLKAWKGCKSLELENLNFSAWLYKIASNTVNDYYRKTYREPKPVPIDEAYNIAGDDNPALNTDRGIDNEQMRETVAKLPAHYKEVIELRFFQDFSVADTAKILGRESITIRVWQHRAIKQLQQLYKQNNPQQP